MSYIVPRNKPDRCTNCLFIDKITYDCKLMYGNDYPDFESQYTNCPLIELPSHGRLIDADRIEYENVYFEDVGESYEMVGKDDIDELSTVIEAEGET